MKKGFTLIEVILAIALMVCAVALIVGIVPVSDNAFSRRPPEKVLLSAIKRARIEALERGREVSLKIDTASVVISDYENKTEYARAELWSGNLELLEIVFEPIHPENLSSFILTGVNDDSSYSALRFHPDGSMSPVKISLKGTDGTQEYIIYIIDTFSGALLKDADR